MLNAMRKRLDQDEEGFTLIELMVVVLIIGILIAIAVPAFLGARTRANDRAAQSDLRSALTAQQTFFTDSQVYAGQTDIRAVEPSLNFQTSTDPNYITVTTQGSPATAVCMERTSASGTVWAIYAGRTAGTYYRSGGCGTVPADVAAGPGAPWVRNGFPPPA